MTHHHPGDDLLLALAAGHLRPGQALPVSVHLESCPTCRAQMHTLLALGGALLDEAEPMTLAPDAWARTLARIDAPAPAVAASTHAPATAGKRPALPAGMQWPSSLRGCDVSRWYWMGPGMRFARVTVPLDREARLFLLRVGPGRSLPCHTHDGLEHTQVLHGAFNDGRAVFAAGDFDATDCDVDHQPVVEPGGECVCLAYLSAPLRFNGRIAGLMGSLIGL